MEILLKDLKDILKEIETKCLDPEKEDSSGELLLKMFERYCDINHLINVHFPHDDPYDDPIVKVFKRKLGSETSHLLETFSFLISLKGKEDKENRVIDCFEQQFSLLLFLTRFIEKTKEEREAQ